MYGSRIFNEAKTAKDTRVFRSTRRRLERRRERINILQSLIYDDMEKEFPNFFQLLRETSLDFEDKIMSKNIQGTKYNLFSDEKMTDKDYYHKFPTIYHLRKYLIETTEKVDLRLVYLAIHNILKYRGNFLYDGDFSNNDGEITEKLDILLNFLKETYNIELKTAKQQILEILSKNNITKANKKDELIKCFEFDKIEKQIIVNIINSFLGYTFDINKIFDTNIEKNKISFSGEIENDEEIKNELQDNSSIFEAMNEIYSWFILQDILRGKKYISEAMIEKYEKYKKDLYLLKKVYREYFSDEYNDMFKKYKENNYVAYNGKSSGKNYKRCTPEEFFKKLKSKIKKLPDECEEKELILKDLEENNFLKRLTVTENSAIPYQLHKKELEKILENQSKYYNTLKENKDNIIKLFTFRIPYYVGPLSK